MNFIHRGPQINEFYIQWSTNQCILYTVVHKSMNFIYSGPQINVEKGKRIFKCYVATTIDCKDCTVSVISRSNRSCKDDNARYTTVSLKPLSDP